MNFKKQFHFLSPVVLVVLTIFFTQCSQPLPKKIKSQSQTDDITVPATSGLNRTPLHINYSKHAKCRMACRHIDETEIADILKNGIINYKKSALQGENCHKKYAVEGFSKDRQHLRIIFAPCGDEITVVTCIDIGEEWRCDCK